MQSMDISHVEKELDEREVELSENLYDGID